MFNTGSDYFALGMASGAIHNNQISSNDIGDDSLVLYPPWQARLNNDVTVVNGREGSYWKPNSWSDSWIQVLMYIVSDKYLPFCQLKLLYKIFDLKT